MDRSEIQGELIAFGTCTKLGHEGSNIRAICLSSKCVHDRTLCRLCIRGSHHNHPTESWESQRALRILSMNSELRYSNEYFDELDLISKTAFNVKCLN